MKKGAWIDFSLWLAATELVGILSGWLAGDIRAVYQNLHQPPFSPPGWVFPVMWGILYAMMAISAYLIQHADSTPWKKRRTALLLYAAQLAINFSWSIVFFRFQKFGAAIGVIGLLILLVIAMIVIFRKIRPAAAGWNIPYLLWLLFAAYLNIGTFPAVCSNRCGLKSFNRRALHTTQTLLKLIAAAPNIGFNLI